MRTISAGVTLKARNTLRRAAMVSWIVWLIVAALLGVAELVTTTLAFGLIAVAALVAAAVGAVDLPVPVQIVAFIVATGGGLGVIRPIAMRNRRPRRP
jgi:membrane protein implicated in regulation of membrane protease activity